MPQPFIVSHPAGAGGSDHGALSGLLDDDHTQYALLAGRAGGQTLRGGTAASNALTLESTAHATKGIVALADGSGLRVGTASRKSHVGVRYEAPQDQYGIVYSNSALKEDALAGLVALVGWGATSLPAGEAAGVFGYCVGRGSPIVNVTGLTFNAGYAGAQTTGSGRCISVRPIFFAASGTITALWGYRQEAILRSGANSATEGGGFDLFFGNFSNFTNVYGIRMADITLGTNRYLLWLGNTTPILRLDAGNPTVSGQSQLHLLFYDGAAVGLRRVSMGGVGSGGTGYRALIVPN